MVNPIYKEERQDCLSHNQFAFGCVSSRFGMVREEWDFGGDEGGWLGYKFSPNFPWTIRFVMPASSGRGRCRSELYYLSWLNMNRLFVSTCCLCLSVRAGTCPRINRWRRASARVFATSDPVQRTNPNKGTLLRTVSSAVIVRVDNNGAWLILDSLSMRLCVVWPVIVFSQFEFCRIGGWRQKMTTVMGNKKRMTWLPLGLLAWLGPAFWADYSPIKLTFSRAKSKLPFRLEMQNVAGENL